VLRQGYCSGRPYKHGCVLGHRSHGDMVRGMMKIIEPKISSAEVTAVIYTSQMVRWELKRWIHRYLNEAPFPDGEYLRTIEEGLTDEG
jgi:hypothetical protein